MTPQQVTDILSKGGFSTILIIAIVVLWNSMKRQAEECKDRIEKQSSRITNLMNAQMQDRARIAELETLNLVQPRTSKPSDFPRTYQQPRQ